MLRRLAYDLIAASLFFVAVSCSSRASLTKMRSLTQTFADGAYPVGQLALNSGTLYGFTQYGVNGFGSFYKMTTAGAVTTLKEFGGAPGEPYLPTSGPVRIGTNFYGTSYYGGANDKGTVFRITATGVLTLFHSFGATATDGASPNAALFIGSDGRLYGTTVYGGSEGEGTIFRIDADGMNYTVLRQFNHMSDVAEFPYAGVVEGANGVLYGTTYTADGYDGALYKINKDGSGFGFVFGFSNGDPRGYSPFSDLVKANDNKLYGACVRGGQNGLGTIFSVDTSTNTVSLTWAFDGYTGATPGMDISRSPQYRLTVPASGSLLYGTTRYGGLFGYGTLFKIDTSLPNSCTPISSFNLPQSNAAANPLTISGTTFYGTSYYGGATATAGPGGTPNGFGAAWSCTATGALKLIHSYYIPDACYPNDSPTVPISNYCYGTLQYGGLFGWGAVYKIATSGSFGFTVLHSFNNYLYEGSFPIGGLIKAADGSLYGCTTQAGNFGSGTIFKITTAGVFTVIHHFRSNLEGSGPYRKLVQGVGADKFLYGVCQNEGPSGRGTIFRTDTTGKNFQIIHYFTGSDGSYPFASLLPVLDPSTNATKYLYGATDYGGQNNYGVLYRITPSGSSYTKLHDFDLATGGETNFGGSIVLTGGILYGTGFTGGTKGHGVLYAFDTNTNAYSVVHNFDGNSPLLEGIGPTGGLSTDGSGSLYGTCLTGGAAGSGTIWKFQIANGALTKLHDFLGTSGGGDGESPRGGVMYDAGTGLLFGTTYTGGAANVGIIFSQTTSP